MGIQEWGIVAGIVIAGVAVVSALVAAARFFWKAGGLATTTRKDIEELQKDVASCHLQLTNHLPHQIMDLSVQVEGIRERLELHESREEKHWDLLTRVLAHKEETTK
jgi:hypothetical protein